MPHKKELEEARMICENRPDCSGKMNGESKCPYFSMGGCKWMNKESDPVPCRWKDEDIEKMAQS